jgi:hypothetical protein|tara:strand:+ start:42354 stop:42557 length:204 start_codon:yes stop_codon:yes gene_type:complete
MTSKKTKIELALQLSKDILHKAKEEDLQFKRKCISEGQAQKASGEGYMVYFMHELVQLLEDINNEDE